MSLLLEDNGNEKATAELDDLNIKEKILQQFEFYFSDSNVRKDKYIQELICKYNANGFIPLCIISGFKRVRQLSQNPAVIRTALKNSDLLELSEDGTGIKRRNPVSAEDDSAARTIFVEQIPPVTDHDRIIQHFRAHGKVLLVSLPRNQDRTFKGFAFLEYSTQQEAESAIEKEKDLKVCSKFEWYNRRQLAKKHAALAKEANHKGPGGRYIPGTVVEVGDIPCNGINSKMLLDLFNEHGHVFFVDYREGDSRAHIRFSQPDERQKVVQKAQSETFKLTDCSLSVRALKAEEEAEYWNCVRLHIETRELPWLKRPTCQKPHQNYKPYREFTLAISEPPPEDKENTATDNPLVDKTPPEPSSEGNNDTENCSVDKAPPNSSAEGTKSCPPIRTRTHIRFTDDAKDETSQPVLDLKGLNPSVQQLPTAMKHENNENPYVSIQHSKRKIKAKRNKKVHKRQKKNNAINCVTQCVP